MMAGEFNPSTSKLKCLTFDYFNKMHLDRASVGMNDFFMLKIQAVHKLDTHFFSFISLIFVKFRIACCSSLVYDKDSVLIF
jgi:hypothetical protein